jgi:hypothetical protein
MIHPLRSGIGSLPPPGQLPSPACRDGAADAFVLREKSALFFCIFSPQAKAPLRTTLYTIQSFWRPSPHFCTA